MQIKIPKVPIKLDKERHVALDLGAVVLFEHFTLKAIFNPAALKSLSFQESVVLLWALLSGEDKKLSVQDVVEILLRSKIKGSELGKKLFEAWNKCIDEIDEQLEQEVKKFRYL